MLVAVVVSMYMFCTHQVLEVEDISSAVLYVLCTPDRMQVNYYHKHMCSYMYSFAPGARFDCVINWREKKPSLSLKLLFVI